MKVSELIAELKEYDKDSVVMVTVDGSDYNNVSKTELNEVTHGFKIVSINGYY